MSKSFRMGWILQVWSFPHGRWDTRLFSKDFDKLKQEQNEMKIKYPDLSTQIDSIRVI